MGDVLGAVLIIAEGLTIYFVDCGDCWTDYLDPAFSLLIVLIILATTIPIVQKTVDTLYQATPDEIDLAKLKARVLNTEGVHGCHELHVWRLVNDVVIGTCHVRTNTQSSDQPKLLADIRAVFHSYNVHSTTVQLEYEDLPKSRGNRENSICEVSCIPDCNATRCCD